MRYWWVNTCIKTEDWRLVLVTGDRDMGAEPKIKQIVLRLGPDDIRHHHPTKGAPWARQLGLVRFSVGKDITKPTAGDHLRVRKTCIVFHELLNQPLHIGNIVVGPKLDWQPAKSLNREGQSLDQKVGIATSNVRLI
jgi:hypothetical protein